MVQVAFFPQNKLGAEVCSIYNGHTSIMSFNTDTLRVGKYELVELEMFKNNIQGTAFISQLYTPPSKIPLLKSIENTGRIGYGLYYDTTDYQLSQAEIAQKAITHQEFFKSNLGYKMPAASLGYGREGAVRYYKPYFLAMRNSAFSFEGDSNIAYSGLSRKDRISKPSSTRTYDSFMTGDKPLTRQQSIDYSKSQLQRALTSGGFYNDFIHWHNVYADGGTNFFADYFKAMNDTAGSADVWRATMSEVASYSILKDCTRSIGSVQNGNSLLITIYLQDVFAGTVTDGVDDAIDFDLLQTPLSIKISTAGTALEGKNIACKDADSIRKLNADNWIVNVEPRKFYEGYYLFEIIENFDEVDYYSDEKPTLAVSGNTVSSDLLCKWVVWRKLSADSIDKVKEVIRVQELTKSISVNKESGYDYYVGAISKYKHSSLVQI